MNQKPNIIFILIDDLGWRDLTCFGSSFYETPVLDKLAKEGMLFTDAYASCPVCSPTRASILTGKYPATLGLTDYIGAFAKGKVLPAPFIDHLPLEEKNLARTLKEAGYRTYAVGKWHLGKKLYWPEHQGFDVNIGGCDWGHAKHGYFSPYHNPSLSDGPKGEYLTDRLTDEAIKLMDSSVDSPFFLYMSFYAVHMPLGTPKPLIKKYKAKVKALGLDKQKTVIKGEHFPIVQKRFWRMKRRIIQSEPKYAGMIENMDSNIGRLLEHLKKNGKLDNTIVIFTSDNGGVSTYERPPTSNAPLSEGKGWMYEGGNRVPLIIRYPKIVRAGSQCSTPITSPDFFPTLLDLAGLDLIPEQHCDGVSLIPLLKEEKNFPNRDIFWHFPHYSNLGGRPGASIRSGDYKLIQFMEDNHYELYNLREDLSEKHDLVNEKPELVNDLAMRLRRWQDSIEAKFPTPNPNWDPKWNKKYGI